MQEQELFQGYEIRNWDFSPRIYKILAVSAIFNILALLVIGSTNLLTTKGCDSPLVGRVCQVIDTVYVGGTIISTPTETASVDYTKTQISPDDEIIWIPVSDDPFKYPEGYFAESNPEPPVPVEINNDPNGVNNFPEIPDINSPNPTLNGGGLLSKPPVLPKVKGKVTTGPLPDSPLGNLMDNPTIPNPNKPGKNNLGRKNPLNSDSTAKIDKQNNNTAVKPSPSPSPDSDDGPKQDSYGIFKNKKPLKDFASTAKTEAPNVKLDAPFSATIEADLDYGDDGKTVVLKNPKPVQPDPKIPNDEQMSKLAQAAILAVGDSGWLGYLKTLGVKKVVFTLSQDDNFLSAKISGEQKDENSAKTNASGLNTIISFAKAKTEGDEKILLDGANTTAEGKFLILNVAIPKQIAQEMINRKLKEAEDKPAETKPNGSTAQFKDNNKNTAK